MDELFRRFFGDRQRREARGLGTGFIVNADGHIVTNNHVVEDATQVLVKLVDGRELAAKVVGRDPKTDLALIKVDASGLPILTFGDSGTLQVGEPVMAIGNPFGLDQTVTTGIVSATGRVIGAGPYDDFIQTDASINPGNSGGPLVDARGQVVGINTAIFSRGGGSEGIGFAIPVNLAKTIVTQLVEHGRVIRASLGVSIQPVTEALAKGMSLSDTKGALVSSVVEGSPAMKAGLKTGDVIVEYDGKAFAKSEDLPKLVAATEIGREVAVKVMREGKPLAVRATVARLDEPESRGRGNSRQTTARPGGGEPDGRAGPRPRPGLGEGRRGPRRAARQQGGGGGHPARRRDRGGRQEAGRQRGGAAPDRRAARGGLSAGDASEAREG
jgi:serine protease Do